MHRLLMRLADLGIDVILALVVALAWVQGLRGPDPPG
jgi:hypothetical protein